MRNVNTKIIDALMRAKTDAGAEHTFFLVSDAMLGYKIQLEYFNIIMNNLMFKKCHSSIL